MNDSRALGCFMDYCNRNMGYDDNVTNDRFQDGIQVILNSHPSRFAWCENVQDVLTEINWPDVR